MARLRIATFNLLHGVSLDTGRADPAELARAVSRLDVDVLGLQEVDRAQPRSGGVDQTALVAGKLGAEHHRFVPTLAGIPGWGRGSTQQCTPVNGADPSGPVYGVGLVSRLPVRQWVIRRFAASPFSLPLLVPGPRRPHLARVPDEPRVALAALLDSPAGPLTVITAHLSFVPGVNVRQLRALASWAKTLPGPRVLAADVNLPGPLPGWLTGWDQLGRRPTYPSYAPRVQFDHVLGDGVRRDAVTAAAALPLAVSDHCAFAVELDL